LFQYLGKGVSVLSNKTRLEALHCQQVSRLGNKAEQGALSRPTRHSLSLTQLVYALPELRSLNVRKAAIDGNSSQIDLWTPACYSCMVEIMRAMRKRSPWCNLETFVCDAIPGAA